MRPKTPAVIGCCALIAGCASAPPKDDHTLARTRTTGAVEGRPTLGMPIPIPGHTTVIVPFAVESEKALFEARDPFARGGFQSASYARARSVVDASVVRPYGVPTRWHNAVLHDLKTGEEWTILDKRGVISRFEFLGPPARPDAPFASTAIAFLATTDDTNGDGVLNDLDASVAIIAAGDGRRPRTATPRDAQVWDQAYDAEKDRLFFCVVADSNGDQRFTADDPPVPYVVDLKGTDAARPLVSAAVLQRIEGLLKQAAGSPR